MVMCRLRCRQISQRLDLLRKLLQCTVNDPYSRLSNGLTSPPRIRNTKLMVMLKVQCHINLLLNLCSNERLKRLRSRAAIMKTGLVLVKPHCKRQLNRTRNPLPRCWTIMLKLL